MVNNIAAQLEVITREWYTKTCAVLMRYAKTIAKLSRHQFDQLEATIFVGRVKQVTDLLQKVRLHGMGIMAAHLVPKLGVSSNSFAGLDPSEQQTLNKGSVQIKVRGGVKTVKSRNLTDKELQVVIASWRSKIGPVLLAPAQQHKTKGREDPVLYSPVMSSMRRLKSGGIRIMCVLRDSNFVAKFTIAEIAQMASFAGGAKGSKKASN
jgi:hypothetical protein